MKGSLLDNIPIRGPMKEQQPGKKADITSVIKVSRIILQSWYASGSSSIIVQLVETNSTPKESIETVVSQEVM